MSKPEKPRMHPNGMAALIAAILAGEDVKRLPEPYRSSGNALALAIEHRMRQVHELAREYYKEHPVDFENDALWRVGRGAGLNNLAKMNRANLWRS